MTEEPKPKYKWIRVDSNDHPDMDDPLEYNIMGFVSSETKSSVWSPRNGDQIKIKWEDGTIETVTAITGGGLPYFETHVHGRSMRVEFEDVYIWAYVVDSNHLDRWDLHQKIQESIVDFLRNNNP